MAQITIKLADYAANNNPNDTLVAYGIGSTLAVILYDKGAKVGGIVHFMLPCSAVESDKSKDYPAMCADSGIPLLVKSCVQLGAHKEALAATLAGGAFMLGNGISQRISEGNLLAARELLSTLGVVVMAEDIGGNSMRAVRLDIATGKVYLRRPNCNWEEIR